MATRKFNLFSVFIAGVGLIACGGCANLIFLHPPPPEPAFGAVRQVIPFRGGTLEAWTMRSDAADLITRGDTASGDPPEPQAYVLQFVGNGSRAESAPVVTAWMWRDHPVEVWTINYPGYGGSTGPADLATIGPASLAAYDYLAQRHKPIFVMGHSLGTTAALCVAARRPVSGVILKSPPAIRQMVLLHFGWWNGWLLAGPVAYQVPDDLDSLANAAKCHEPAIVILTGRDHIVPFDWQVIVSDAYVGPHEEVLTDADHDDPFSADTMRQVRRQIDYLWEKCVMNR
jgi:alpha/beta superfamily hydrolase